MKRQLISIFFVSFLLAFFSIAEASHLDGNTVRLHAKVHNKKTTHKHKVGVPSKIAVGNTKGIYIPTMEEPQIEGPSTVPETGAEYLPIDLDAPGQSFVTTGPYIGVELEYNGSNLIINNPSVNQDVTLLKLRKNINKRLAEFHRGNEPRAHLLLSGLVEVQAGFRKAFDGHTASDIDLTSVELDGLILSPSNWVSGLFTFNYDNSNGFLEGCLNNNSRTENSRVFVNKAFIVLGNFQCSPYYATMGQLYVPFGVYSTSMISSTLPKLLARTKARAIVLGFDEQCTNGFFGSAFVFRGDSYAGSGRHINNGGANLGYHFELIKDCFSGKFGASVIANLADSQGLQDTGNGSFTFEDKIFLPGAMPGLTPLTFGGFGGGNGTGSEKIAHRVPAYDVYTTLSITKSFDFIGEFVSATKSFAITDLTLNSHGAKPRALNAEIAYTFQGTKKPVSISVGYGMSKDCLAIGLPAQRYIATINTSIWKSTLESLEFRHDIDYAASSYSTGSNLSAPSGTGHSNNAILAQFDLYF